MEFRSAAAQLQQQQLKQTFHFAEERPNSFRFVSEWICKGWDAGSRVKNTRAQAWQHAQL